MDSGFDSHLNAAVWTYKQIQGAEYLTSAFAWRKVREEHRVSAS